MTVTLLILPEATLTATPWLGLALVVPLAGVTVTWAAGGADGLPAACPDWLPPLEPPAGLEQAAANRATIPKTATMPSLTRRLVNASR